MILHFTSESLRIHARVVEVRNKLSGERHSYTSLTILQASGAGCAFLSRFLLRLLP
jgi:hypothetical protein